MAVDITLLFRASVKTVKTRNKALGVAVGGGVDGSRDELFRRSPRPKGDFSSRAREVTHEDRDCSTPRHSTEQSEHTQ
ncbi:Syntaxin-18 [Myotis brandtii]|uniref:Syntaxin-18 n=1 Tax=Myotis brandtii TaxID=109478 RepID=S7MTD2_MYOBR|nr:Syntaxin-18 [Myotis brandtii]